MKTKPARIACFALVAAFLTAAPAISRAADPTNAPAAPAPAPPTRHGLPFHGKVLAVDTNAMTFTVAATTFAISSETRIIKDGKPAVLADILVGEAVSVFYKKDDDGKATAITVRVAPPRKTLPKPDAKPVPPPAPATGQQ